MAIQNLKVTVIFFKVVVTFSDKNWEQNNNNNNNNNNKTNKQRPQRHKETKTWLEQGERRLTQLKTR